MTAKYSYNDIHTKLVCVGYYMFGKSNVVPKCLVYVWIPNVCQIIGKYYLQILTTC